MNEKFRGLFIGAMVIGLLLLYLFSTVDMLTPMASLESGEIQYSNNNEGIVIISLFAYVVPMIAIIYVAVRIAQKSKWVSI